MRVNKENINKWVSQPNGLSPELFSGAGGWIGTPSNLLTMTHGIRAKNSPVLSLKAQIAMFSKPKHADIGRGDDKPVTNYFASGWEVMGANKLQKTYIHAGHVGSAGILTYNADGIGWALLSNNQTTALKTGVNSAVIKSKLNTIIETICR